MFGWIFEVAFWQDVALEFVDKFIRNFGKIVAGKSEARMEAEDEMDGLAELIDEIMEEFPSMTEDEAMALVSMLL